MFKITIITLFTYSLTSYAQFTVSPFGASNGNIPPIGENNKSNCGVGRCSFELKVEPFCFAANLRSYDVSRQLKAANEVQMDMTITSSSDSSKTDKIKVLFPAMLTFASDGIKINCDIDAGQNMQQDGAKNITCKNPDTLEDNKYQITDWKYVSGDLAYNYYMSRNMHANKLSGNLDDKIVCYYKFDGNNRSSKLVTSSVGCYFPSTLPDLSNKIKVYKDNNLVTNATIQATVNFIKITFDDGFKAIADKLPVKHGQVQIGLPPKHSIVYTQPGVTSNLASDKEKETFDEANAYKTFSTKVKFVSEMGFCGGFKSPLMLFFDKNIPQFTGVSGFKLFGNKDGARVHWPEANVEAYFLSLPKNNKVNSYKELFGETDIFKNGFESLKIYDSNGDNYIDDKDPIFKNLRLWRDKNSNGLSEKNELIKLSDKGIDSISLNYSSRETIKFDQRARGREKSTFSYLKDGENHKGDIIDIWLSTID